MKTLPVLWLALLALVVITSSSIAQSPGDTAGFTNYPYLATGPIGSRIVLDGAGNAHVAWVSHISGWLLQQIYYNYKGPLGWAFSDGLLMASSNVGGPQIGQYQGRAAVIFHSPRISGAESLFCAIDAYPGIGIFSFHQVPNGLVQDRFMWPYLSVDRNNRFHVVETEITQSSWELRRIAYTHSSDAGDTWTPTQVFDTVQTITTLPVSSSVSDKTALVYYHPVDTAFSWKNDVYYIQSNDGVTWDFASKVNVTGYGQEGDSLFAHGDLDAIYDYNDNLHIIWNAVWVSPDGTPRDHIFVYHYSSGAGQISLVTDTDMPLGEDCEAVSRNLAINKMSLGVNQTRNALYTVYCKLDTSDCTANGFANGELYMQYSLDGGAIWTAPVDITNSHTPGCLNGECASDYWPSMAEVVDDNLHIFYAGYSGDPDIWETYWYGPMLYLAYPNPVTGMDNGDIIPRGFSLSQNYPNPFNARTTISFELDREFPVCLDVYNITGARIAALIDKTLESGTHSFVWDAKGMASGIYYFKLSTLEGSSTKKMVLLK